LARGPFGAETVAGAVEGGDRGDLAGLLVPDDVAFIWIAVDDLFFPAAEMAGLRRRVRQPRLGGAGDDSDPEVGGEDHPGLRLGVAVTYIQTD
jgi:hypothetical protein